MTGNPAATLLLSYFEVDVNAPVTTALNTTVTIVNTVNPVRSPVGERMLRRSCMWHSGSKLQDT